MFEAEDVNIVVHDGSVSVWEDGVEYVPDIYVEDLD